MQKKTTVAVFFLYRIKQHKLNLHIYSIRLIYWWLISSVSMSHCASTVSNNRTSCHRGIYHRSIFYNYYSVCIHIFLIFHCLVDINFLNLYETSL